MIWWDIWDNYLSQNFFFPYVTGEALAFLPWKCVFLVFFLTKNLILLVHLNHFPQYFLFICENMSIPSWFWKDPRTVFYLISIVNENNDHFCIFIVKKCHFPCVSHAFFRFEFRSFPYGFGLTFDDFILIIRKYHFPCVFNALFLIFLKIFVFHLFCNYIFFFKDFKGKTML